MESPEYDRDEPVPSATVPSPRARHEPSGKPPAPMRSTAITACPSLA